MAALRMTPSEIEEAMVTDSLILAMGLSMAQSLDLKQTARQYHLKCLQWH